MKTFELRKLLNPEARKIREWISAIALTTLGALGSLGYILNIRELKTFGYFTGASPTPLVFNQVNGFEYWASRGTIKLEMVDGSRVTIPVDNSYFHRIRGPHIRKIAAVIPMSLAPVLGDAQLYDNIEAAFCRGKLAGDLGLEQRVSAVQLSIESPTRGHELKWQTRYECKSK